MRKGRVSMISGICMAIPFFLIACTAKEPISVPSGGTSMEETLSTASQEAEMPLPPSAGEEALLKDMLSSAVNGEIVDFTCKDYDNDGKYEAFAVVGSRDEQWENTFTGAVWFVSENLSREMKGETRVSYPVTFTAVPQTLYSVTADSYGGGSFSYVYGVKDGQPYEEPISGQLMGLRQAEDGSFTAVEDTYDACTDGTGHTWKNYWFYWDNGFHEYGAVLITEEQLMAAGGGKEALAQINAKKGQVTEILYRDNQIININYLTPWSRDGSDEYINNNFMTLRYGDGTVTVLDVEDTRGVYAPALLPSVAVYPDFNESFAKSSSLELKKVP